MKNTKIIGLVVISSVIVFLLSVTFSLNMSMVSPKALAKAIEKDPVMFMDTLKASATKYQKILAERTLKNQFKNPAQIDIKGRVVFGNKEAPITIVEYSDFQCPYCARAAQSMKQLIDKYEGRVNLVYKHYPLNFHPLARPASNYFEAIAMIDHKLARKFHDDIFDNFEDYATLKSPKKVQKKLKALAKKLKVYSKMKKHLKAAKAVVEADLEEANRLKVRGTPNFFVNGIRAGGANMEEIIDKLLKDLKK